MGKLKRCIDFIKEVFQSTDFIPLHEPCLTGREKEFVIEGSILATLTAAQLSGFGVYLLATTSLYSVSSLMNITLPFVMYTALSGAIKIIIGPLGWISIITGILYTFNKANFKKLVPIIIYINYLRVKQMEELKGDTLKS